MVFKKFYSKYALIQQFTFIIIFILQLSLSFSQVSDSFSDGDISQNPTWSGDVSDFVVNEQLALQLNAPEAGESILFVASQLADTTEWQLYLRMEFNPSDNNKMRYYLWLDAIDLAAANGYFIEAGENGSDDGLKFYRMDNGSPELLGSGNPGTLANGDALARIKVLRYPDGIWQIFSDYSGESNFSEEFMLFDEEHTFDDGFLGLHCFYTSSRRDKFFFDDISMETFKPDVNPPILIHADFLSENQIQLKFNEPLDTEQADDPTHFNVDQGIGNPTMADLVGDTEIVLGFNTNFQSGITYTIVIDGVKDLAGNVLTTQIELVRYVDPAPGDLIINEILFDPRPGGFDYLEIYNRSSKFLNLQNLVIGNSQNQQEESIQNELILEPESYLAFTENVLDIMSNYTIQDADALVENDLPAFNNLDGDARLYVDQNGEYITLDSFYYHEDYHFALLDDSEGVSLERISFDGPSNDPNNWHSAAEGAGFGTPGYENSVQQQLSNAGAARFHLEKNIFSPNNDGVDDVLILGYNLESAGYILNLKIFDSTGRFIHGWLENELLGTSGFFQWDGITEGIQLSKHGIYILWIEAFHPNGDVHREKMSFILADYLD